MSLDEGKWKEYYNQYPEAKECTIQSKNVENALPCYEYLYKLKPEIPKELYAYLFRKLLQFNTKNVSKEFRLKMFEGVSSNDIMYQDELDAIENFEEYITVYRGAAKDENIPGLSWTLIRDVAECFPYYRGKLFEARVPKSDILLYYANDNCEGEIIANVTSDYRIIKED